MTDEVPLAKKRMLHLTHGQAAFSASMIGALSLALSGPLSKVFQTKEDAARQQGSILVQSKEIDGLKELITTNQSVLIEKINDVVRPVAKDVEHHETRIVNLEFLQMTKTKGK